METLDEFKKRITENRQSILLGTLREDLPISKLDGNRYILEDILKYVEKPLYDEFYQKHINKNEVPYMIWPRQDKYSKPERIRMTQPIIFPPPRDININMMPIKMGGYLFSSLPDECKHYATFIYNNCMATPLLLVGDLMGDQGSIVVKDRIAYLTIHEGLVPIGEAQRRPGLHIERPGAVKFGGKWHDANSKEYRNIAWGLGCWHEDGLPEDGVFMASTVDNSCAIWDCVIDKPEEVTEQDGGLEKMRHLLGEPKKLRANEMCWFTDRTPHESLPLKAPDNNPTATHVYRQFFRLVMGPISVWYSKHNTPNPKGVLPDAPISDDNKFE